MLLLHLPSISHPSLFEIHHWIRGSYKFNDEFKEICMEMDGIWTRDGKIAFLINIKEESNNVLHQSTSQNCFAEKPVGLSTKTPSQPFSHFL